MVRKLAWRLLELTSALETSAETLLVLWNLAWRLLECPSVEETSAETLSVLVLPMTPNLWVSM